MKNGILFVISAPSGTGKTTILKKVMAQLPGLNFSVSHTTRKPRTGEQHGRDYFFVERETFEQMIAEKQFIEWARVHDNYYGTSIMAVSDRLGEGEDIILDIDVQGATIIRDTETLSAVQIFIAPPGLKVLEERLRGRNTEDEKTVLLRLKNAEMEMKAAKAYDYLVVNDQLEEAVETLMAIIVAERARARRRRTGEPVKMESVR
ncbi:guanylate kinase [Desulfopila aestuarii]|uniref:Guanylate kinase n=1 Tax=Desulfopila aestuarii DSM 18488 TaxID=1121416 RepID=A0A1M7XZG8_9BACT|nr:guanylate kinase [Desulfopila aestuarii]SHO44591.1 guanylate kinase [Desulfopila aestuarii DSM 18488]